MPAVAFLPQLEHRDEDASVKLLIADDDAGARALLAEHARAAVEALVVLEADDGAAAVQVGLQQRPPLALLDVAMPRLGGIEAAVTLRELRPQMRFALHTADPLAHRDRARDHRLPLFDKLDVDGAIRWLDLQVRALADPPHRRPAPPQKPSLECSVCGYAIARTAPPERCPMCSSDAWIHSAWRPFGVHA